MSLEKSIEHTPYIETDVIQKSAVVATAAALALAVTSSGEVIKTNNDDWQLANAEPKIEYIEPEKTAQDFGKFILDQPPHSLPPKNFAVSAAYAAAHRRKRPRVPYILKRIRGCESGRPAAPTSKPDYKAQNPTTSASGAYQFMDGTWQYSAGKKISKKYPKARNAPQDLQDKMAIKLHKSEGTSPWNASRHCWG
jgi:hypothetical protein